MNPRDPQSVGRVVQTLEVLSGKTRIDGTRIGTDVIWSCYEDGASVPTILRMYPTLTADDIEAALAYETAQRRKSS